MVGQWPLLWPVLLIGWGLGLLLRGTPLAVIGGAVSAITFGVMGGGAIATGFGGVSFASAGMVFGALMVIVGAWFLVDRYIPAFDTSWLIPGVLIVVGIALLVDAMGRSRNPG